MRVLLVAYAFPPDPSPQSLRWAYLCRELGRIGVQMHVLAPRTCGEAANGLPSVGADCHVIRTFAGPVMGTISALQQRRGRTHEPAPTHGRAPRAARIGLNWKGRCAEAAKSLAGFALFPDVRAEWNPWAERAMDALLQELRPDVLVTSHEPASVLRLGLRARKRGVTWLADLGDPVLAPYTPARWRGAALRLERAVCARADHVTVTSAQTKRALMSRHEIAENRVSLVTQGFPEQPPVGAVPPAPDGPLEMLYTGSVYAFRRLDAVAEAVARVPGVRLSVATRSSADTLSGFKRRYPERFRLLGAQPHLTTLQMQHGADVLLDIGNASTLQVPGKFFEYLGACRPILHVGGEEAFAAEATARLRRGWVCPPDAEAIAAALARMVELKVAGQLEAGLDLGREAVSEYAWSSIARRMAGILGAIAGSELRPDIEAAPDSG